MSIGLVNRYSNFEAENGHKKQLFSISFLFNVTSFTTPSILTDIWYSVVVDVLY